jgi:hypothetical protein
MHTKATLATDLRALGLSSGDVVMAHASARAIGGVLVEFLRTYPGTRASYLMDAGSLLEHALSAMKRFASAH